MSAPVNWRAWGAVAATLLIGLGAVTLWYVHSARNAPELLLAQAYTRQRLIDYRLPDGGYAPISRSRGGAAAPSELTRAQGELAVRLEHGSSDASLLRLQGLAELQALRAGSAVAALEQARQLRPKDPQVLADLGAAYAERSELEQRPEDFARALEFLSQALLADPLLLRAQFNRALVLERMNLLEDAIAAWDRYLEHDQTSRWASEARDREAAIRERQNKHAAKREMLFQGPGILADPASSEISPDLFLDSAVIRWLASRQTGPAGELIDGLARKLANRHGDVWLRESLREVPAGSPLWSQLKAAVEANVNGNTEALSLATQAREAAGARGAAMFGKRAWFEMIYALDRTQQPKACADQAARFLAHDTGSGLPWLGAAVRIEAANCLVMLGQEGKADALLAEAARLAQAAGLNGQWMRARGVRIGVNTNAGDPWFTFTAAPQFLADYWSDGFAPNRVQQVAFNLSTASQFLGYPNAACSFAEAATRAISETGNRRVEALTRARLSALALSAGQIALAKTQADLASNFFSHDDDPSARGYRDDAALAAAAADLAAGDFGALRHQLEPFSLSAEPLPTFLLDLRLSRLKAAAALHDRNWENAGAALDRTFHDLRLRLGGMSDPEKRASLARQAAPLYRMRAQLNLDEGRPDQALETALDLYSWSEGNTARALHPPPGETWLVYLCLDDKVASWTINASGKRFRWVPGRREEIGARIARLGSLADSPEGDVASMRRLGAGLFTDLVDVSSGDLCESCRLVVVPDGEIAALPFSLLYEQKGNPLGLAVQLVRAHSLPLRHLPAGLTGSGLILLAGAAVVRPGITLPPLPELDVEARYVAGQEPVRVLSGPSIAAESLGAVAPTVSWLHFAGHGYSNAGNGALFTSGSAGLPLIASQIVKMNWTHCDLAVLSACWAGTGESRGFTNPESLVQAFLTAGARGVVAPAWAIHSGATAIWMREFYAAMRRGMDAPTAVRAASRYLSHQSQFQHPYYWASFAYFT
jgi:tetratricopeptide (TPR) repeat protein